MPQLWGFEVSAKMMIPMLCNQDDDDSRVIKMMTQGFERKDAL